MPILIYLILLVTLAIIGHLLFRLRVHRVTMFRVSLVDRIERLARRDRAYYRARGEALPSNIDWRYELFSTVSFDDMLWSFKPLTVAAFYGSEDAFLTPPKKTDRLR